MNPKLSKRRGLGGPTGFRSISLGSENDSQVFSQMPTTVKDQAALLLSIADIAKSEIRAGGLSALWDDEEDDMPRLPSLSSSNSGQDTFKFLAPRTESLEGLITAASSTGTAADADPDADPHGQDQFGTLPPNRIRSVSVDNSPQELHDVEMTSSTEFLRASASTPPSTPGTPGGASNLITPIVSPPCNRNLSHRKHTLRMYSRARQEISKQKGRKSRAPASSGTGAASPTSPTAQTPPPPSSAPEKRSNSNQKALQGECAKGIPIKKILRKKFSWKNYPELEQFLILNREEYLRHSALNYTVQQKQYNNRLTERLLELATEHGYVFDVKEFSFVTVRDRIRCYYKSYVQSAKKRGILMGYAARKAGLLTEEELGKSTGKDATIVTRSA